MFVFHSCNESYALSGVCEKADITMILLYKNFSRRLKMHEHDIFGTVEMEGAISLTSINAQAGAVTVTVIDQYMIIAFERLLPSHP